MTATNRPTPPLKADERSTLAGWLDFYRATLVMKCEGLSEEQLRHACLPPSPMTLTGLVQHASEVERTWFRRVWASEDVPPLYPEDRAEGGPDGGFALQGHLAFETVLATWHQEVARARDNCATRSLDEAVPFMDAQVSLRWIHTHLIAEYARHCGHADLLREQLDGRTGV